jgi:WD40 repeat protein
LETYQPIGQSLEVYIDEETSVAFSPDGKTLASSDCAEKVDDYFCARGEIVLWDLKTHQPIGLPLKLDAGIVTSLAFSPDGKTLASGTYDASGIYGDTIILWDLETHQPIGQPFGGDGLTSLAFSPDGKILAASRYDQTIILWDLEASQPIAQPLKADLDHVTSFAFSPDGKTLALGSNDNSIILWDLETHHSIGQPLKGYSDMGIGHATKNVAFSPDGRMLVSSSCTETISKGAVCVESEIILWDVLSHQTISQPLTADGDITRIAFSPNGKTLASGSGDGPIMLWDMSPQSWIEQSCQRVGRNFTLAEWAQYFPNEDYRQTCPQWPLEGEPAITTSPTR